MSFTKAWPSGLGTGAKVTSAALNVLDTDHANSLDKSSAGDTLSGVVTTSGAGSIHAATAGGVSGTAAGGITATVAAGIESGVASGIALTGGSADWPTFGASGGSPRTRTIKQPLVAPFLNSAWNAGFGGAPNVLGGTNATSAQPFSITQIHNGATLATVKCFLCVNGPHSQLPANMPKMTVYRRTIAAGNTDAASLTSLGAAFASAASASAWDNSNQMQSWSVTVNAVIDTTQYVYYISLIDENGSGSVAGNIYEGFELDYTGIASMQFP